MFTKAKKGGNAYYNISLLNTDIVDSVASAPSMPETAAVADPFSKPETNSLGISDTLNFGKYNANALTDASDASNLAKLDDKTEWLNIASLA